MAAVGVAASLYHGSWGSARRLARKVDYWTIAYTSSAMVGGRRLSPRSAALLLSLLSTRMRVPWVEEREAVCACGPLCFPAWFLPC